MKNLKSTKTSPGARAKKLALQRDIVRRLTSEELGRVAGRTNYITPLDKAGCCNPIYSA